MSLLIQLCKMAKKFNLESVVEQIKNDTQSNQSTQREANGKD